MMNFKRINWTFVNKNYPILAASIDSIADLSELQKERIAGLAIEIMDKCEGTPDIFQDEIDFLTDTNDEDEYEQF